MDKLRAAGWSPSFRLVPDSRIEWVVASTWSSPKQAWKFSVSPFC
ncbi:hypothetical protein [Amycolatopsis sp. cmx-11-12]